MASGGRIDESASLTDGDDVVRIGRANDPNSLHLFLDDGGLDIPIAFWNVRRVSAAENKVLLPRDEFLNDPGEVLGALAEAIKYRDVVLVSPTSRDEASMLRARIVDALATGDPRDTTVRIWYSGHR